MTPIERVLAELRDRGDVKRRGKGWRACCPAHDDNTPSLDIDEGQDGRALLICRSSGCSVVNITHALGLEVSDLFTDKDAGRFSFDDRIQATYDYTDEAGKLLFQAVRLWAPAPENKTFRQRRPDGKGGWIWDLKETRRVLYRLPELLASSGRVYLVEGEKDADNLRKLGLTATTNPMGAEKWRPEYAEHLRGRDVAILPDNDKPGRAHAEQVAASLKGVAAKVRICALPDLPDKGDVSDWLKAGGTVEALVALAEDAAEWEPGQDYNVNLPHDSRWPDPVPASALSVGESLDWLVEGLIARKHTSLFNALAKAGKTTWTSCALRCLQSGKPFMGRATKRCRTLVVSEESELLWLRRRDALALDDSVSFLCRPMMAKPSHADWSSFLLHLRDKGEGFDLILLDTLSTFAPWKSENDSAEISATFAPINLLTQAGFAVLLNHHFGKSDADQGRAPRGSSAILAAVDISLELRRYKPDDDDDRRRVLKGLGRFSEIPGEVVIELSDDSTHYTAQGEKREVATREMHLALIAALPTAPPGIDVDTIHESLPEAGRPQLSKVRGALVAGIGNGWTRAGEGKRGDPYRYWRT